MPGFLRSSVLFCIAVLCVAHGVAGQWPSVDSGAASLPNVEIALAPPEHPWPQLSSEMSELEHSVSGVACLFTLVRACSIFGGQIVA